MGYFTVMQGAKAEFEEKKSRFIGHVQRVNSEEEAKKFIDNIKSKHSGARHNVYAYVIGQNRGIQRYSDDGEPQGTGGIPTLEVIKRNDITDVVVVVTRYFGGILLGTGGLCRAYSKAATLAIEKGKIIEKVNGSELIINIEYDILGKVQYILAENNIHIENIDYTDKVQIKIYIETEKISLVKSKITEISSGNCELDIKDEDLYYKVGNRLYNEI